VDAEVGPVSITVIGIGADGWSGLAEPARARVLAAEVLLGGERHLALVPPVPAQVRRPWPRPLSGLPSLLAEHSGSAVVALASGDPFLSGIGTTLAGLVDDVEVWPGVSSVALARARMRWSAESSGVLTLVGRDPAVLRRELAPGRRLLLLSSDETTPGVVAGLLREAGCGPSRMTVLGDLGSDTETRLEGNAEDAWEPAKVPRLHVLAVEVDGPAANSWAAGLPDDAFEHDGQLTKRDLRASALARLRPHPGQLLWDVGAGAVEAQPDRAARITRNAAALGVPSLAVVQGRAPDALVDLPRPDAVFVGGGGGATGVLDLCRDRLAAGGRLVVHGVTLETEQLLLAAHADHGGELTRVSVETVAPLGGRFRGWSPARAVTQWAWEKR
jgi:precorrin-6Y C5,15-methyltransferase (decarboxylating)